MSFFLHTKYSKNWKDFFTLESSRMPIDKIEAYYEKIVTFFTRNKKSKFIFINFPLLHHHNQEVVERVKQINSIFSSNRFLQNHSFFIPATEMPSEYLDEQDINHFITHKNRSIYDDYSVIIKAIFELNFSPKEWNILAQKELKNPQHFFLDAMRTKFSQHFKETAEIKYWQLRKTENKNNFSNSEYQQYYTKHFDLPLNIYNNKRILDIGCGPCGTLEWANMSLERIGLDPLVNKYIEFGTDRHNMIYVKAKSESIPFKDHYFDIVTLFNSLSYVDDLDSTIREIKRVLKPGGLLLLLTDVNRNSNARKPHKIPSNIIQKFLPQLLLLNQNKYELKNNMVYYSFKQKATYKDLENSNKPGLLAAKFCKLSSN
jgi:ubiquinone/menaquinone biosynthesis C-methylase UbiE